MAFVPHPLPRSVTLSSSLVYRLDRASRAAATLAGVGETLPNPHLLIRPFLRREAVLSSRIEGTQASMSDVFLFEASGARPDRGADVREVINYVHALEHGLARLETLPLCVRLTDEMHAILLEGVRGEDKTPGKLRTRQVWIGSEGTLIHDSRFIPPPADLVRDLLTDWEQFLNEDLEMPPLVRCALMHYQFEAIHPYLDGNGRIGRLLIVLLLCAERVLPTPLLYLSDYFERNRKEYSDQLYNVSATGQWEPWLRFFFDGVAEQADDAVLRSRRIRQLQEQYRDRLQQQRASGNALRLLDELFANPYMTTPLASRRLGVTPAGARLILERLAKARIVEVLPGNWPRFYVARELLEAIEAPVAMHAEDKYAADNA
ncbi:MAG TPA: Fic family protein [Dehalococcoidia bacterium]|nr:Fic family protein [Dehalococcoidia bacterium]